jgi:hypothetical protein
MNLSSLVVTFAAFDDATSTRRLEHSATGVFNRDRAAHRCHRVGQFAGTAYTGCIGS